MTSRLRSLPRWLDYTRKKFHSPREPLFKANSSNTVFLHSCSKPTVESRWDSEKRAYWTSWKDWWQKWRQDLRWNLRKFTSHCHHWCRRQLTIPCQMWRSVLRRTDEPEHHRPSRRACSNFAVHHRQTELYTSSLFEAIEIIYSYTSHFQRCMPCRVFTRFHN